MLYSGNGIRKLSHCSNYIAVLLLIVGAPAEYVITACFVNTRAMQKHILNPEIFVLLACRAPLGLHTDIS